jgi:hypothetical protein
VKVVTASLRELEKWLGGVVLAQSLDEVFQVEQSAPEPAETGSMAAPNATVEQAVLEHDSQRKRLQLQRWTFYRLSESEVSALGPYTAAVNVLSYKLNEHETWDVPLGALLVALERFLGASALRFDEYKGSFAFPLLLVGKDSKREHVVLLRDRRESLVPSLFRIEPQGVKPSDGYVESGPDTPIEALKLLISFVATYGTYLDRYASEAIAPFTRWVESEFLMYGHDGKRFFGKHFEESDAYFQAVAAHRDSAIQLGPAEALRRAR